MLAGAIENADIFEDVIVQDKYVGDVGDYGKYGLLRALFSRDDFWDLGIIWYLVPDETTKTDGKHVNYLSSKHRYCNRSCDPTLFDELRTIVKNGDRNVANIENVNIFRPNTVFFSTVLSFDGINANSQGGRKERRDLRKRWFELALQATKNCNAVFLDPDNGIERPSLEGKKHLKDALKYVYFDEIEKLVSRKQVVVLYHHLGRHKGGHELYIQQLRKQLQQMIGCSKTVYAIRFKPYSPRVYFVITDRERQADIEYRIREFIQTPWKRCFELITEQLLPGTEVP